ncbi:GH17506 [Drosophila grimshawi]|uniref:GH17506 n=1 Tax=Drosophila grimshawi TaxID=7222 RepID=B4JSU2_DROGR|nr:GH17506 [Drosophila grimshawi]
MDFLSNLIKRPISIALPENETKTETEIETETETVSSNSSSSAPTSIVASSGTTKPTFTSTSQITLAMNTADLDDLFDSAAQDLDILEEQHKQIIESDVAPLECAAQQPVLKPNYPRETITQLLNDINVNLDQVSANEMEHLQAMSLELSPLAVRPSPRHNMDQQKALISALLCPSQPVTPTTPNSCEQQPVLKFTGLPEYDETQIPELPPLSVDMEAQLKTDAGMPTLSSTVLKVSEPDYNSDSDVYAECLSLNSVKLSADQSELDAYASALNEVLDHHLSNATATTLENTLSEAATVSSHNDSCESMDVDDINETMEMLKDVLAPEDCHLLQQQLSSNEMLRQLQIEQVQPVANEQEELQHKQVISASNSPKIEQEEMQQMQAVPASNSPKREQEEMQQMQAVPASNSPKREQEEMQQMQAVPASNSPKTEREEMQQIQAVPASNSPKTEEKQDMHIEQLLQEQTASAPISPPLATMQTQQTAAVAPTIEEQLVVPPMLPPMLPTSPPIPTHRTRTAEELAELRAMAAFAEPPVTDGGEQPATTESVEQKQFPASPSLPIASVAPMEIKHTQFPTLTLNITNPTSQENISAPTSPAFPIKSPAGSPGHFPRSPHAPPEHEEMDYLEQAIIEHSAEQRSIVVGGVIAKSPLPVEVFVSQPDPEQSKEAEESPLNDTFDSTAEALTVRRRDTYGLPLDDANDQQRRTFTIIEPTESKRRTMTIAKNASPALEATEANILGDELESMDVDVSMSVDTTLSAEHQATKTPSPSLQREMHSPPMPTHEQEQQPKQEPLRPSPPLPAHFKRPSIHKEHMLEEQTLSVKEQLSVGDEKDDVYVDHFGAMSPIPDDIFKAPQFTSSTFSSMARSNNQAAAPVSAAAPADDSTAAAVQFDEAEFHDGASNNNSSNNAPIDRSSLLLKFDPLLGAPVPVNQQSQQEQTLHNILSNINNNHKNSNNKNNNNYNNLTRALSPTLEEHDSSGSNQSGEITKKHAKMSVDVIDNDCNKTFDNSTLNSEDKTHKYHNMDELEKKIKNEVTRSEDIENKLKEAEQREEALVKRITEKDKNNSKLNGVIEAYEKAIAELIHDKEQLVQNHERQMLEVQTDRDSNYTHLMSLETTFSDLHVKYEKSKEMTSHLKQIEENLLEEKKKVMDKLRQQEQRYEQMKSHAMQQMEIANKKLVTLTKEHTDEVKKLKALLKKEEVSRISTAEQLQQKSRENADLLKICEELIYDKGQGGSS